MNVNLARVSSAIDFGMRTYLRNPFFLVLVVIMPPSFITLAFLTTPDVPFALPVKEGGIATMVVVGMPNLHGAVMVPMTGAFLAGMVGLFVMLGSREADLRLVFAGYPALLLLSVRLAIIAVLTLIITVISVGVTTIDFVPDQLTVFFLVNLLAALEYALIGALVGTFVSGLAGTYIMFFAPMIDYGIVQNPMLGQSSSASWIDLLPSAGPMEIMMDASFSPGFDSTGPAFESLVYLLALTLLAALMFRRQTQVRRQVV